jgi:hypothetical protein
MAATRKASFSRSCRVPKLASHVRTAFFDQANATQPSLECFDERPVIRVGRRADRNECKRDWASVLLPARRKWPCSRTAEKRDELAPSQLTKLHHVAAFRKARSIPKGGDQVRDLCSA